MFSKVQLTIENRSDVNEDEDAQAAYSSTEDGIVRTKTFDDVLFDVLRVPPETYANQLTLIDIPLFKAITPEELTSCSWTSKRKTETAPNVVNFTRRFNHVSFWVTREVLNANTAKIRAERINHFIKVAKKLLDLNNFHSMKAIVSGLQSAPIYRLTKTWNNVPKREKEKLEKLNELVSEDNNRHKLRMTLQSTRLPCIPYLGMYLTDLTYINTLHPPTGGLDKERTLKMNEVLRIIADFQQSNYDHIPPVVHVQKYLLSLKYIEELQKFVEDDNYKLSLKIEPQNLDGKAPARAGYSMGAAEDIIKANRNAEGPGTLQIPMPSNRRFTPGHRKSRSLGNSITLSNVQALAPMSSSLNRNATYGGSSRNLLDDSLIEGVHSKLSSEESTSYDSGLDHEEPETHPIIQSSDCHSGDELTPHLPDLYFKIQGFLKRKKYLGNGHKPKMASWQRFWIGLTESCLVFFMPKYRGFGGHERSNFRVDPCKILPLHGWCVVPCGHSTHPDLFQMSDCSGGTIYRYLAGSSSNAHLWCKYIREAIERTEKVPCPQNLISFDESPDDDDTQL